MITPNTQVDETSVQRARLLDIADDIIRTAKANGRGLTTDEKARHDAAIAGVDAIDANVGRSRTFHAPNVNRGASSVGADSEVTRNLDSMFWATAPTVAGISTHGAAGTAVPVEQAIIRTDINDPGRKAPRISAYRPEHHELVRTFQETVSDMSLFGLMVDKQAANGAQGFEVARAHRAYRDQWNEICRALDVDTSGEGGTWVPTGIGASVVEKVRASGKVAPLFQRINLPSNPWKWPIEGSDASVYRVAEPTGDTETAMSASTPGTVAATFDAEIFGARTLISRSLDADSAVVIIPFIKDRMIQAFVDAEERAILDGDTDGTHQDSDVGASTTDPRTAWDGLRKRALAETSQALTTTSAANLLTVRKNMGKWGLEPSKLAYIVGVSSMHALLADSNLLTVDKMGPNATILNGMIGSLYGIPVIVSEHVRENLNASGVADSITTTKTYAICVRRDQFVIGDRMALEVEVDDSRYRETYQRLLVAFSRADAQFITSASTDDVCSVAYNITSGS